MNCHTIEKLGTCVNVDKSKIVVFRNEGKIKWNEKWFISNDVLEIVKQLTNLEMIFQCSTKFTKAIIRLG